MSCFRQQGKKLSPWTVIKIMARVKQGAPASDLAKEFGVNRTTITRWVAKWGKEADLVECLKLGNLALKATAQMDRAPRMAPRNRATA